MRPPTSNRLLLTTLFVASAAVGLTLQSSLVGRPLGTILISVVIASLVNAAIGWFAIGWLLSKAEK